MSIATIKTRAEQALAGHFEAAAGRLPGGAEMRKLRADAFGRFAAIGLPHRRVEEWKYTDLRARMAEAFAPAEPHAGRYSDKTIAAALGPLLSRLPAVTYVLVNGRLASWDSGPLHQDDPNLEVTTLGKALATKDKALIARLRRNASHSDIALELNLAFVTDGAILRIPDGAKVPVPVHIIHLSDLDTPGAVATRTLVTVGRGARVTILESHISAGSAARQTSHAAEIEVGPKAEIEHVVLTAGGPDAQHLATALVRLEAGAQYRAFQQTESTGLVRNQTFLTFAGENAAADISGTFLARGSEHIDTTLVIDHAVPRCTSRELFKGVLADEAKGVFQGKVIVRPGAQKTDGKQKAQALLLSPTAEFLSKPELEIFADDVVCGHGSTSTELDSDQLFYLRSRGIGADEAQAMLTEAFVGEVIDAVGHEGLREALRGRARDWLAKGAR